MKKKVIIFLTVILFIIGIAVCSYFGYKNAVKQDKTEINISVYNKENEVIYDKSIETTEKYLVDVLMENDDLNVKTKNSDYGAYITSILNIEEGNNYYWSYYINGDYAQVGVSSCEVTDESKYTFKIEKYNY